MPIRAAFRSARVQACVLVTLIFVVRVDHAWTAPIQVPAGADLQAALDGARAGDELLLAPGAIYTGNFVLPLKEGNGYITVRSSGPLPAAGVRVTPADRGALATLQSPNERPALTAADGAHHWRLVGLELVSSGSGDIVSMGGAATRVEQLAHDLIFDRVYVHGAPDRAQKRGFALNTGAVFVINSYISDIKAQGQDSQAIVSWNGTGPFVIENNHLEAAGENIMFGGADPGIWSLVPSDITVRRNLLTKPVAWRQAGWTVKNAFELKNARRVLLQGNVLEHVWQSGQTGVAVLLTPRNQGGRAPWSVVEDVTIESNVIRHAGAAINVSGHDDERPSAQTARVRIVNNLVYDIDQKVWGGSGVFLLVGNEPTDLTVERNTVLQRGAVLQAYGRPVWPFVFRGNLARHNQYGVFGDSTAPGQASLDTYFPGATFVNNVLAGGDPGRYPAGNLFPSVADYDAAVGGITDDQFAVPPSPLTTAGPAGGARGADLAQLLAVLTGAQSPGGAPGGTGAGGAATGGTPATPSGGTAGSPAAVKRGWFWGSQRLQ